MTIPEIDPIPSGPVRENAAKVVDVVPAPLPRGGRLWSVTLAAGVLAGLVAWLGGEACRHLIPPTQRAVNVKGMTLNAVDRRSAAAADAWNGTLAFAILGAALGAGLGAAGGIARGGGRLSLPAAGIGLVAGALGVAAVSAILLPTYNGYKQRQPDAASQDLVLPLLVHLATWSTAGALGGLAFGRAWGQPRVVGRAVRGGLVGAAMGTVVFDLVGAAAFPEADTTKFLAATWMTRLFARLAVALLAAAGVAYSVGARRVPTPSPAVGSTTT